MLTLNKVILMGTLLEEPKLVYSENSTPYIAPHEDQGPRNSRHGG
jgi:hypothetical protein